MSSETFKAWRESIYEEVEIMRDTACHKISDNPARAREQLGELSAYFTRSLFLLARADAELSRAKAVCYPRTEGTVQQRQIGLDNAVLEEQTLRDELAALCIGLDKTTSIGQSSLRSFEREYNKGKLST